MTHEGLFDNAQQLITDEGLFCVVLPYLIGEQFIEISQRKRVECHSELILKIVQISLYHRILLAFQRQYQGETKPCNIEELIIRNNDGHYTTQFQSWVTDFYLYY